ncbi:MAG TPA: hypothetical protein PKY05_14945, partial [Fibrobacteria bacterium]|nr:hypothetical protein [Fibrobacteria bacterium]
ALDQVGERKSSSGQPVLTNDNLRSGRDRRLPADRRSTDRRRGIRRGEDPSGEVMTEKAPYPKWLLAVGVSIVALVLATFLLVAWFVLSHS